MTPGESKQQEQGIVAYHQSIKTNFIIATETTASSIYHNDFKNSNNNQSQQLYEE